jgi:hypothetical protein
MTEPVTDAEVLFLALLDEWALVFPDKEHIDLELREVYLPRALKQMTRPQLNASIVVAYNVINDFTTLVDIAIEGAMRESWVIAMKDVIDDFQVIMDALYCELDGRLH